MTRRKDKSVFTGTKVWLLSDGMEFDGVTHLGVYASLRAAQDAAVAHCTTGAQPPVGQRVHLSWRTDAPGHLSASQPHLPSAFYSIEEFDVRGSA